MILSVEVIFIAIAALLIGALAFTLRAARRRSAHARALEQEAEGASRASLEGAERRSNHIIHRALRQARALLVRAELAGIREHARESLEHRALHARSREELDARMERAAREFTADVAAARESYVRSLAGASEETQQVVAASRASLESAARSHEKVLGEIRASLVAARGAQKGIREDVLREYAARAEKELRDLGRSAAALLKERVELETREARTALAGYVAARQRLVDEHIVELVERTAAIALTESLSLAEHARLVYRALEEARREGFFEAKES